MLIIREAKENYDSDFPEYVYIDDQMFLSWILDAMLYAGADEPPGYTFEEGGPGQSSAISLLYATEPNVVIGNVEEFLRRQLANGS